MKDKLVVDYAGNEWRIMWYLAEEDDLGSILGDSEEFCESDLDNRAYGDDWDHVVATLEAKKLADGRDNFGYFWDSENAAKKALKEINLQLKARRKGKPWPEWALEAIRNGWRAPKGWEP